MNLALSCDKCEQYHPIHGFHDWTLHLNPWLAVVILTPLYFLERLRRAPQQDPLLDPVGIKIRDDMIRGVQIYRESHALH